MSAPNLRLQCMAAGPWIRKASNGSASADAGVNRRI